MKLWLVRAGRGGINAQFVVQQGVAAIGWDAVRNLRSLSTVGDVKSALAEVYPNESERRLAIWAGEAWRFTHEIEAGDIILTPHADRRFLSVGSDQGRYQYRSDFPSGMRHTRIVKWETAPIRRSALPKDIAQSLRSWLTVARIRRNRAAERVITLFSPSPRHAGPEYVFARNQLVKAVIVLEADGQLASVPPLTPLYLAECFLPFLQALNSLNHALTIIQGLPMRDLSIASLRQQTPVEVNFKGTAKEVLHTFREEIVPWRRKAAQRLAEIEERKRKAEAEAEELRGDEARERLERMRIENAQARSRLQREELDYAIDLARKFNPDAKARQQMQAALEIKAALEKVRENDLTLALPGEDTTKS
jgi:hypothetical protein